MDTTQGSEPREAAPRGVAAPTLNKLSSALGVATLLIGLCIVCGWIWDVPSLTTWLPTFEAAGPFEAILMMACGCALFAVAQPARLSWLIGQTLACLVAVAVAHHLFDPALTLERALLALLDVREHAADEASARLPMLTEICLLFTAGALALAPLRSRPAEKSFVALATLLLLLVAGLILPLLFGLESIHLEAPYTPVAIPELAAQGLLTLGVLALRPHLGWMRLLSGDEPAARELRSLAIGVVASPLVLAALLQVGLRAGLYPQSLHAPLLGFGSIVAIFIALLMTAARLHRIDRERQHSLAAKERAEAKLGIAFAAAKMVGVQLDLRSGILRRYVSAEESHSLAYERYLATLHPDDRERVREYLFRQQQERRREYQVQYRVVSAGAQVSWILEKGELRYDEDGRPYELFGVMLDISQDMRVREALRESEERFRLLAESMPQIVYVSNSSGEVEYINQRWEEYTGRAVASLVELRALTPAEDYERVLEDWQRALELGETFVAEYRLRGADGTYRWFLTRAVPVRGPDGRVVRWCGTATDIDAQKRAHEELCLVTDHADVMLAHCDGETRYLFVNKAYTRSFKRSQEEVIGKTIAEVLGPTLFRSVEPYVRRVLAGEPVNFELGVPVGERKMRFLQSRYVPDVDPQSGKVRGFVAAISDVTERRELEEQLRTSDRRKDEFIALLAHELRNPLAPIRYAAGLLKPGVPPEITAAAHDVIERQVAHMGRLLDDLLDVSRLTRNTLELRLERVDLREIVTSAVNTVRPLFEAVNHEVHLSVPVEPAFVEGDSTRLLQIVGNLLNNAAKFTDPGGRIDVELVRDEGTHVVQVRDNGVGIAPEFLPQLFDLFVQGDRMHARASSGLGVGLSLAKHLVELHAGTIEAHSEGLGKGSVFTVRLPAAVDAEAVESPALAENIAPIFQRRHQLLIVDDNLDAANSLAILAQMSGYVTHIANDGLAAIEMAELIRPEAIIMDLGMPRMSGFEAARWVRQQPWGKQTVLIAVTGWGQEEDRRRSREAGFDVHLTKPVDSTELLNELQLRCASQAVGCSL